jgi:hypothetical protein
MQQIVVLAGNRREALAYAKAQGIRIRYCATPGDITHATRIIELPGFKRRRDRHSIAQKAENWRKFKRVPYEVVDDFVYERPARLSDESNRLEIVQRAPKPAAQESTVHKLVARMKRDHRRVELLTLLVKAHQDRTRKAELVAESAGSQMLEMQAERAAEQDPTVLQKLAGAAVKPDYTDDRTLLELKADLNAVGWTLKKLPAKKASA